MEIFYIFMFFTSYINTSHICMYFIFTLDFEILNSHFTNFALDFKSPWTTICL